MLNYQRVLDVNIIGKCREILLQYHIPTITFRYDNMYDITMILMLLDICRLLSNILLLQSSLLDTNIIGYHRLGYYYHLATIELTNI